MDSILLELLSNSQSKFEFEYEKALNDLRFVIERFTMNRFSDKEKSDYGTLFYDKKLVDYRLSSENFDQVKKILIYILFNFPDRAVLTSKCLKVVFDTSILEAICNGIEIYKDRNDLATSELIYAITNTYDDQSFLKIERVMTLFKKILKSGGDYSKTLVKDEFKFYNYPEGT